MSFSKNYIKEPLRLFLKSFKDKKLPITLGIDTLFYIIFYLGFKVYASKAKSIIMSLQNLNLGVLQNLNNIEAESANQLLNQLQSFLFSIISATIVFILFIIVILTLIKGYQWSRIVKNKLEPFDYVKLLLLNILWFILWIIILAIPFLFIEKQKYLTHIHYLLPFILYFTLFLYLNYSQTKSIGKALLSPIKEGIIKLHKYISQIIIIILFLGIPSIILKLLKLPPTPRLLVFAIISLLTLAILKIDFYSTQKEH